MKQLEASEPESEFHLVVGSDLLPGLLTWNEGEKFVKEIRFLIFNRQGHDIDIPR